MGSKAFFDFCDERLAVVYEVVEVEGVDFGFMPLSSDQFKEVAALNSSSEMLDLAANYGLAFNREKLIDNKGLSQDFDLLWSHEDFEFESTPSLRHQIGRISCDLSGLTKVLNDMIELEKPEETKEPHIEGDDLPDGETTLESLAEDARLAANAA